MPNGARGVIYLISSLAVTACFADVGDPGAAGTEQGPETLESSFGDGAPCGPLGNLTGFTPSCAGFAEYTECIERECADGYDMCLGSTWATGDFSDGACPDLMQCIADSPNRCEHACAASGACQDCLVGQLSICETYCAELVDCSTPTSTGDDPAPQGPCGQLSACCNSVDPAIRELCILEQADATSGGDSACEVLLLRYCP